MRWIPAGCAAALGLWQLGVPSIWIDEGYTADATTWTYERITQEIWWAHFTFAKSWSLIAGSSEFALRLPSVIGAVVAVLLLYGLARRMFDERIALVASLLLAFHPFVVKWSQQARGYSILLALVIGATWLVLRALERDTRLAWTAYAVVLVVLLYWHPFAGLLFFAVHIAVYWRNRSAWFAWWVVLLLSFPWLLFVVTTPDYTKPTSWIPPPDLGQFLGTTLDLAGAPLVGLMLAALGAALVRTQRTLLLTWAVLPFALSLVASLYDPVFQDRYLIITCPAFAILGAVAIMQLAGRARVAALAVTAAVTLVSLFLWYAPDGSENWRGENWREATEFVMREGGAEVLPGWADAPYRYYGGRPAQTRWVLAYGYQQAWPVGEFDRTREFGEHLRAFRRAVP